MLGATAARRLPRLLRGDPRGGRRRSPTSRDTRSRSSRGSTDDILWRAALIVGVFPGAWLAHLVALPSRAAAQGTPLAVLDPKAIATSFGAATVMTVGALVGGGCTTGAFISAWPTLSVGSLAMAGTFFVVSMATSNARLLLLRSYDLGAAQAVGDRVYD